MASTSQGFDAFLWSIGQQESSGNYNIPDSSAGAIGKYQLLPSNIVEWSREMGNPVTVAQFRASPQLQDKIATFKLSQYVNKYGYAGAAAAWYSGSPNPNSNVGNPPVSQYVSEVLNRMNQYTGAGVSNPGPAQQIGTNPLNPGDWVSAFTGMVGAGDVKDMMERLGLILFGGLFVAVGVHILTEPATKEAEKVVVDTVSGGSSSGGKSGSKAKGAAKGEASAGEAAAASEAGEVAKVARVAAV